MLRSSTLIAALLLVTPPVTAQGKPALFYTLPPDGTWVQYDLKGTEAGKEWSGTLRISSVGKKELYGQPHRWIEIKLTTPDGGQVRKLLITEKAFAEGQSFKGQVAEGYEKLGTDGSVVKLTQEQVNDFLTIGLRGDDAGLKAVADKEDAVTKLGKFPTRHVTAGGKAGDRVLEYHAWRTDAVPFGVARFEVREKPGDGPARPVLTADAAATGKDAKSEVDESKAK